MGWRQGCATLVLTLLGVACAGSSATPGRSPGSSEPTAQGPRVLTMAVRHEPTDFAPKIPQAAAGGSIKPLFNAGLALQDHNDLYHPHLAEALPQLNTDAWRVLPDGRMETTYRLRPGLAWHDGQPLSGDDFVFAWRVYVDPRLGIFSPKPQDRIEEVSAADSRTVRIRWGSLFPDANALTLADFPPLPRHLLGDPYTSLEQGTANRDTFLSYPYWTTGYVGAGPYRLVQWQPGTEVEAVAFDRYALGRPKIDRLIVRIIGDENVTLTAMLAGQLDLCYQYCLRFEHAQVLKREWASTRGGTVLLNPSASTFAIVQFRPEFLKTPSLLDVRARRALAHTIDKQALQDGLFEGEGFIASTHVRPDAPEFPEVDRTAMKYPFDPRAAEQLLNEAGFTRDRDGFFALAGRERLQPEFMALAGDVSERAQSIMADTWRRAGIQVNPWVLPNAQVRDNYARNSFPDSGWSVSSAFISEQMGTPANRWGGSNRGGWSNPEYDRLSEALNSTLDASERQQQQVRMAQLINEQLPGFILYFNFTVVAHTSKVERPNHKSLWNVHEWSVR